MITGTSTFQEINELHHAALNSQEATLNNFHIYRNEDAEKTGRLIMPSHRCNFFQISLDQKSDYILYLNDQKTRTTENTLYFAGRGKLISWHSGSTKEWKGYNVIFKDDFLSIGYNRSSFLKDFSFLRADNRLALPVSPADYTILSEVCEKMLHEQNNSLTDASILQHYLYIYLHLIRRIYEQPQQKDSLTLPAAHTMAIVNEFEYLINEHYRDIREVGKYADKLFISSKYLSQLTSAVYGKTAKQMILERILLEGQSLLFQTDLTVSQIAFYLNFEDVSHFAKFFQKFSGVSPSLYRKKK